MTINSRDMYDSQLYPKHLITHQVAVCIFLAENWVQGNWSVQSVLITTHGSYQFSLIKYRYLRHQLSNTNGTIVNRTDHFTKERRLDNRFSPFNLMKKGWVVLGLILLEEEVLGCIYWTPCVLLNILRHVLHTRPVS